MSQFKLLTLLLVSLFCYTTVSADLGISYTSALSRTCYKYKKKKKMTVIDC